MLRYSVLIYCLAFLCIGIALLIPILKKLGMTGFADRLSRILYWRLTVRVFFETFFVLAIASLHNMLGEVTDWSKVLAFLNVIVLFSATGYLFFTYAVVNSVRAKTKREKKQQVTEMLRFIQRPLRLGKGKADNLLLPCFFLARRFILAAVFVFMQDQTATQWVIFLMLSSFQIFILAKIKPYGDSMMNLVQAVNEAFLFVAVVLLMPLANVLDDLEARNQIGWSLFAVVMLCIIFNTVILLLRGCAITCDYIKATKELETFAKTMIDFRMPGPAGPHYLD
jgi:hypothetical protein